MLYASSLQPNEGLQANADNSKNDMDTKEGLWYNIIRAGNPEIWGEWRSKSRPGAD
jgi:hypothetical protein